MMAGLNVDPRWLDDSTDYCMHREREILEKFPLSRKMSEVVCVLSVAGVSNALITIISSLLFITIVIC